MSSTQNSNPQQSYEDYEPDMKTHDTEEAHVLTVHLPDFTRQQVGAYYEAAYKRIRVFGEKPIEDNKRKRFSKVYTIPENCDADKLKGQFQEGATITITIPKKPKQPEPEPKSEPEEEPEAEPVQEQEEEAKQVTTIPKSVSEVEPEGATIKNGEKSEPKSEIESSQRESDEKKDENPTPPEPEKPEVTEEESKLSQKDKPQEDQKNHEDEEKKESTEDSSSATEKEKGSESGIPQKDQDQEGKGIPQEDEKKASDEGKAFLQKDQPLESEKSKELERKESDLCIAYESSDGLKKTQEEVEKKELFQRKQKRSLEIEKTKEEIKESTKDSGLKKTPEEKEKQMNIQTASESSSRSKGMIRNMASSASEAVTRLANKFSEEDKQRKLLCAGAAILVVAVGIYASFKLRSMTRQ